MAAIQQTATRMKVRVIPWFLWSMGMGLWVLGIGVGLVMQGKSTLECDRTPPSPCQLIHQSLLATRTERFPVQSLQAATVKEQRGTRRRGRSRRTYQVLLQIEDASQPGRETRSLPLTSYTTSDRSHHERQASRINAFIQSPAQTTLQVEEDASFMAFAVFACLGLVGSLLLLGDVVVWELDKGQGRCKITRFGLRKTRVDHHSLTDVAGIQLQTSNAGDAAQMDPDQRQKSAFRVAMVLNSGQAIPLTSAYTIGWKDKQQIVDRIHAFLELSNTVPRERNNDVPQFAIGDVAKLVMGGQEKRHATIAECQARLLQDPYDADSYKMLALAWMSQGDRTQAIQTLKTGRARLMRRGDTENAQNLDNLLQGLDPD